VLNMPIKPAPSSVFNCIRIAVPPLLYSSNRQAHHARPAGADRLRIATPHGRIPEYISKDTAKTKRASSILD